MSQQRTIDLETTAEAHNAPQTGRVELPAARWFAIRPATRTGVKPLVGFYGKSGSGKTMSALLFARGIVGTKGRITLIDSESGRGSIFADLIPGGYAVLDLDAPFSPQRYAEAIAAAEAQSDAVVVDSMSHEWSGEGGVLDWADQELEKMGGEDRNRMRSWIKPKMAHKMMVQRLLRCKCALICCLRGEEKTHTEPDPRRSGKNMVVTDKFSSPLFDPRFIFEMLLNFETVSKLNERSGKTEGGYVIARKITHPSIGALLPGENEQIGIKHGEALAKWCSAPGSAPANQPTLAGIVTVAELKKQLWERTKKHHAGDKAAFAKWLLDKSLISDTEDPAALSANRLTGILDELTTLESDVIP